MLNQIFVSKAKAVILTLFLETREQKRKSDVTWCRSLILVLLHGTIDLPPKILRTLFLRGDLFCADAVLNPPILEHYRIVSNNWI